MKLAKSHWIVANSFDDKQQKKREQLCNVSLTNDADTAQQFTDSKLCSKVNLTPKVTKTRYTILRINLAENLHKSVHFVAFSAHIKPDFFAPKEIWSLFNFWHENSNYFKLVTSHTLFQKSIRCPKTQLTKR